MTRPAKITRPKGLERPKALERPAAPLRPGAKKKATTPHDVDAEAIAGIRARQDASAAKIKENGAPDFYFCVVFPTAEERHKWLRERGVDEKMMFFRSYEIFDDAPKWEAPRRHAPNRFAKYAIRDEDL